MARTTSQIEQTWSKEMWREQKRKHRNNRRTGKMKMQKAKAANKVSGMFMNRIVIAVILAALIFTVVIIIVFIKTGSEPSTLIENVFRFLSVEGGIMGLIKVSKTVMKSKNEKQNNSDTLTPPEETEE